jgi:ATP-dependent helicase/nuclease subunit A
MQKGFTLGLPDREARQIAVDPRYNVVLEASAGTGKTAVLVDRYVNLVLAGVDPDHILAITFTRKAAAEMRERVVRRLNHCAAAGTIRPARWAALRERLGELAICTIDAFCLALLTEFPLDAGLEPGFTLIDEAEIASLMAEAVDRALRRAVSLARQDRLLALVLSHLGLRRLRHALKTLLLRRLVAQSVVARLPRRGPAELTAEQIWRRALGTIVGAIEAVPGGLADFAATGPQHHPDFESLVAALRAFPRPPSSDEAAWRRAVDGAAAYFLRRDGKARQHPATPRSLHPPSGKARERHDAIFKQVAPSVQAAVETARRELNDILVHGFARLFGVAVEECERIFETVGVLDFDGVLERTLGLLRQMEEFAESRYRLEARYRHILVDEFQDTSRAQWELVWSLVESWGAGLGVAAEDGLAPSIFLVGDRKQSIYGFRDAEVALLDQAAASIERLRPGDHPRRTISHSFRAVPALLAFFNDLFSEVAAEQEAPNPFQYRPEDRFPVPASTDTSGEPLGVIVAEELDTCAERVAGEIARLLAEGWVRDRHDNTRRTVVPGDIAVVFRSRDTHRRFEQALLARGIPTYVYKGLGFFDTDEVKDLTALVRFLAEPTSDLRAAAFLRSRLVRLSDGALAELAPGLARALLGPEEPAAMRRLRDEDRAVFQQARGAVARWLARVDRVAPAELIDEILRESAYGWELRGPRVRQARENVKKFRALLRRLQNRGYPTMARIAARLDQVAVGEESNAIVDAVEAVNLMTVHAAKGLEFPVVFVVNLARGSGGRPSTVTLLTDQGDGEPAIGISGLRDDLAALERRRDREETKRLLYVAMTRARDRLYLSSVLRKGKLVPAAGSLAEVLPASFREALERASDAPDGASVEWTAASGRVHRLKVCAPATAVDAICVAPQVGRAEPRTDLDPIGSGEIPRVPVTAVVEGTGSSAAPESSGHGGSERLLGRLVHRFVERWGLVAPASDELAREARRLVQEDERAALLEERDTLIGRACELYRALCRRPDVVALFEGRCQFEVPLAVRIEQGSDLATDAVRGPAIVRGVLDCLVWKPDGRLVVIEVKTGAPRPEHEQQLAWYVRAARAWLPNRDVSGVLVYA